MLSLNTDFLNGIISDEQIYGMQPQVSLAHEKLLNAQFNGSIGWPGLPDMYEKKYVDWIVDCANKIRKMCDIFIVVGIGGSYLGARAAIEFLNSNNYNFMNKGPKIFFVGNSISSDELSDILAICENNEVCVNVVSKSGSTIEPSIAFRVLRGFLAKKYENHELKDRIYCTTDYGSSLQKFASKMGYTCLEIPKNVGGRYSLLTPAGLLPVAVSGANITNIINGAKEAAKFCYSPDLAVNDCYKYAAVRNVLYNSGKKVELVVGYQPKMHYLLEWWKQLFGESEGKNNKGIFPASAIFSTDLHSLGQYVQEGSKILFETIINVQKSKDDIVINYESDNSDNLNYIAGKSVNFVNQKAFEATVLAHTRGSVPNIIINMDEFSEYNLGYLIYFFEKSCAISAYILDVNPFDQPGVENYKIEMFKLLGRPNF